MPLSSIRRGQLAGLTAALLFGCSAPLISTLTSSGSALSIAGLLYAGAALALLAVRLVKGRSKEEASLQRQDWPALTGLTLLGGLVGWEHLGGRGLISAGLTVAGALVLSQGSLSGSTWWGACLIALATLAWAIDNNISQRLSLRDPIQIASLKAAGPSLPMLALALLLGEPFPPATVILALLGIGALGYGISIWLDLLALRDLGAAREAVIFSPAPFVGAPPIRKEPPLAAVGAELGSVQPGRLQHHRELVGSAPCNRHVFLHL